MHLLFKLRRWPIQAPIAALFAAALLQAACGSSANTFTAPAGLSKCAVTTDASVSTFSAAGGTTAIAVNTERECQWTASADGAWLKVTAGSSGQGPGTVQVAAVANGDPVTRTAAVVVNNQRVQVTQEAAACAVDLGSRAASFAQAGGTGSVDVRASSPLCTWTAASTVDWIAITSGTSGKGSAPVAFNVSSTPGAPRSGTITIAGLSFTVTQSAGCSFDVSPLTHSVASAGGSVAITVTAGPGCAWTATSETPWIGIASGASGTGNGAVTLSVAATTSAARSGTATVAGRTVTVNQGQGCTFTLSPASASAQAGGDSGRFDVRTADTCGWSAASNAAWLTVTAGSTGTGNGSVQYAVAPNTGPSRAGTLTVGDRTFTVAQEAAAACSVLLSASTQDVASGGGSLSVGITAAAGCPWTATSTAGWIAVSPPGGSGNGAVQLTVAANPGADRTGIVSIGGQAFTVVQAGAGACTYSLSSSSQQVAAGGGSGSFTVNAGAACPWTATTTAGWISVTSPASGTGTGTIQFTAAANNAGARSGAIVVAGQTFTVTQAAAAACTATVSPDALTAPAAAGSQSVQITTSADCSWTAASNASWISIPGAASGTGNGAVQLAMAANSGPARTGTATIAARVVTVAQESGCTFSLSRSGQNFSRDGGKGTVSVTTADGCTWTARSDVSWISITKGANSTGSRTVEFDVDSNRRGSAPRTGTLTIAGQTFTVNQGS